VRAATATEGRSHICQRSSLAASAVAATSRSVRPPAPLTDARLYCAGERHAAPEALPARRRALVGRTGFDYGLKHRHERHPSLVGAPRRRCHPHSSHHHGKEQPHHGKRGLWLVSVPKLYTALPQHRPRRNRDPNTLATTSRAAGPVGDVAHHQKHRARTPERLPARRGGASPRKTHGPAPKLGQAPWHRLCAIAWAVWRVYDPARRAHAQGGGASAGTRNHQAAPTLRPGLAPREESMRSTTLAALLLLAGLAAVSAGAAAAGSDKDDKMLFFVFTEECFDTLIVKRQLDLDCGKKAVVKSLGYAISVGELRRRTPSDPRESTCWLAARPPACCTARCARLISGVSRLRAPQGRLSSRCPRS